MAPGEILIGLATWWCNSKVKGLNVEKYNTMGVHGSTYNRLVDFDET